MKNHPIPSSQSTAKRAPVATTFKPRVRRLGPGRYLVESASRPGRGHTTTATSCSCTGFSYRGTCRHTTLVAALEPSMQQWYGQVEALPLEPVVVPMSAGAPSGLVRPVHGNPTAGIDAQIDEAEARLDQVRRALHDTDHRDDSYAVLWRQVDTLEREVAALHYFAMRAA